jgi:hypothetical protein
MKIRLDAFASAAAAAAATPAADTHSAYRTSKLQGCTPTEAAHMSLEGNCDKHGTQLLHDSTASNCCCLPTHSKPLPVSLLLPQVTQRFHDHMIVLKARVVHTCLPCIQLRSSSLRLLQLLGSFFLSFYLSVSPHHFLTGSRTIDETGRSDAISAAEGETVLQHRAFGATFFAGKRYISVQSTTHLLM